MDVEWMGARMDVWTEAERACTWSCTLTPPGLQDRVRDGALGTCHSRGAAEPGRVFRINQMHQTHHQRIKGHSSVVGGEEARGEAHVGAGLGVVSPPPACALV